MDILQLLTNNWTVSFEGEEMLLFSILFFSRPHNF